MDVYTIYCASAIASTIVLRSICAAVFPLFSPAMFRTLGDQWAVSVFAFLALLCMPLPILFFVRGLRDDLCVLGLILCERSGTDGGFEVSLCMRIPRTG
jgi:hypothetical protein